MKGLYRWAFKSRFRTGAYGWRGSALAGKRLKEAVGEITVVAKSDPVLAGEGIVSLLERLWPALQGIDTSSGALGRVVHRTLGELIPILIAAPADVAARSAWLERLFQAVMDDGCSTSHQLKIDGARSPSIPNLWRNMRSASAA